MNIYFSDGTELNPGDNTNDEYKYFKMTYLNPYPNENEKHLKGAPIKEEDEDEEDFSADFKEILRIKYYSFLGP